MDQVCNALPSSVERLQSKITISAPRVPMSEHIPPPTYSQQEPEDSQSHSNHGPSEPQILILPTADSVNFQKGFLGAEGERATIEGELQLKAVDTARWGRV